MTGKSHMNDKDKYLGPHKQLGPGSYELPASSVKGIAPDKKWIPEVRAWGLNHEVRRGTSEGSGKLGPLTPFIWDDFMNEQKHNQADIDLEYSPIFNSLGETISREIEQAKQAASGGGNRSPVEKARSDQEAVLKFISAKVLEYQSYLESAHSLYGSNPFYLMKELHFRKVKDELDSPNPNLPTAYDAVDRAYRSALELKRLSWMMAGAANHLPELSAKKEQAEAAVPASRETAKHLAAERLSIVDRETTIRFQFLPVFLVEGILAQSGAIEGSLSQTLTRYKRATDNIIAAEKAAVRPYAKANPDIHFPLSKPELEALKNLVDMQANGTLGKRWQDYHVSLLHKESARHLAATAKAFAELSKRARGAEGKLLQIKREEVQEARVHAAAQAQARRVAQEEKVKRVAEKAEAQRVAQEAKAKREAEKAEAQRAAKEAKAKKEAQQAEARAKAEKRAQAAARKIRAANTFNTSGSAAAAGPLFMTAAGTVAVVEAASLTLQAAIGEAVAALSGFAVSVGAGATVGVAALFYSSKLGNGELPERYAFSTPLSDLASNTGQDLNAAAAAGAKIDLPFRISSKTTADGQSEVFVVKTDGLHIPSQVQVVAATYNAEQKVYTATTADTPPRTLTWTPIVDPGNSSTTLPAEQPAPVTYTGATAIPIPGRLDTFPAIAEAGFDDFVLVFPQDSGLAPIYTMFRDRREDPGVATGVGQVVSHNWLGAASQGEGAPVPVQIADQLRGKEFRNFRAFREAFWKAVGNDDVLAEQFDPYDIENMKKGQAPIAKYDGQVGNRVKLELHHKKYISEGGDVYGVDNINMITPKKHIETHKR